MALTTNASWPASLRDPSERRAGKPRETGMTMVIDKGLGPNAFADLLATAGEYIDFIKLGFGTSPLYPMPLLRDKIELARRSGVAVFTGGTLLESAVRVEAVGECLDMAALLGFDGVEVSDGTIELSRRRRDSLIREANERGLRVFTEYGKKATGSRIEIEELRRTAEADYQCGAELVTVEARESGIGVGLYDERGGCRERELETLLRHFPEARRLMWEAPLKEQQVALLKLLGSGANLGNIAPQEALPLETLRRGLRSDTFSLHGASADYMI